METEMDPMLFTDPRTWLLTQSADRRWLTLGEAVAVLEPMLNAAATSGRDKVPSLNQTRYQDVMGLSGHLVSFTAMVQDTSLAPQIFPLRFTTPSDQAPGSGLFLDQLPASILDPRTRITHYGDRQPVYLVTVPDDGCQVPAGHAFPNAPASKYPIAGRGHQACVAKYYPASTRLSEAMAPDAPAPSSIDLPALGSVITVTGILEVNGDDEEQQVPTIHVLLSSSATPIAPLSSAVSLDTMRSTLVQHLATRFFHNDLLAAELFLLHLLHTPPTSLSASPTSVAAADDELSWPHSLPLTLVVPPSDTWIGCSDWIAQASALLGIPITALSLTQFTLSTTSFAPRAMALDEDQADEEGIHAGRLQLATHSLLVVSDRDLEPGQLADKAVRNLQVLHKVLKTHVLPYAFPYTEVNVPATYAKVVVTDAVGGEVVPRGVRVVVQPGNAALGTVHEVDRAQVQQYIAHVRASSECKMPATGENGDGIQQAVESAYVADRRDVLGSAEVALDGPEALDGPAGPAQLHWQLALARWVGRSKGMVNVRVEDWEWARKMDAERKGRVRTVREGHKQQQTKSNAGEVGEEPRR